MGLTGIKFLENASRHRKAIGALIVLFYAVGVIGMVMPSTFSGFIKLIPFALLLSFLALALFHEGSIGPKPMFCFLLIYVIAFMVEAIGVNTGQIFGSYVYGNALGVKLYETPLMIGINWLFLVYATSAMVETLKQGAIVKIFLASAAMLMYDIVLEQVASRLHMWQWKDDIIPFQNYLAWFGLALVFHSLLKVAKVEIVNRMAILILVCQFLFFLSLFISFTLMS
jgi:putative membrane protein